MTLVCLPTLLSAQERQETTPVDIARKAESLLAGRRFQEAQKLVEVLVKAGRHMIAERPLELLVQAQPHNARCRYLLGFCLLRQFRSSEAEPFLSQAVEARPEKVSWLHAYAKALNLNGRNKTALGVLEKACAIESRPELLFASGVCWMNLGDSAAAEKSFKSFLEKSPDHAEGHYKMGQVLTNQGRYADALGPLSRSLAIEPNQVEAHHLLGVAESRAGDWKKAVAAFKAVLGKVPHHVGALYNLGRILTSKGQKKEGRIYLERFRKASLREDQLVFLRAFVKLDPTSMPKRVALARLCLEADLAEEALENLQVARNRAPREAEIYRLMAETFRRMGRQRDAQRAEAFASSLQRLPR